jgi:hypothetical protein
VTGFRKPTQLTPIEPPKSLSFTFVDKRPAKQLKSGYESLMITNCAYGSRRIGEADITPGLAAPLVAMLEKRFGARLEGKVVSLESFTVHRNSAGASRGQMGKMYTGLIPNLMNDREKIGCAPDDNRGGYTAGEVPEGASPLIAVIDMHVGERRFRTRAIVPWSTAVDAVVQVAMEQMGNDIGKALFDELPVQAASTGSQDGRLTQDMPLDGNRPAHEIFEGGAAESHGAVPPASVIESDALPETGHLQESQQGETP